MTGLTVLAVMVLVLALLLPVAGKVGIEIGRLRERDAMRKAGR